MTILSPTQEHIAKCVALLTASNLIAMPTETVYGLAANGLDVDAIAAIYAAKNRPQFNPLICHVASLEQAQELGVFDAHAHALATRFWPGPLTIVVPRQQQCPVPLLASAGLETIALRIPNQPIAQQLLKAANFPIVAPSANLSGRLSPTRPAHVQSQFPNLTILDGGPSIIGLESSIVGCLGATPLWLRAGGIARNDIEKCLGLELEEPAQHTETQAKLAPGRLAKHYAPNHALMITTQPPNPDDALIIFGEVDDTHQGYTDNLSPAGDLSEAAARLYDALHMADAALGQTNGRIIVRPLNISGLGEAIMDRLIRASASS